MLNIHCQPTGLYRGRVPGLTPDNWYVLSHTSPQKQSEETIISVSDGHIILTATPPVESGAVKAGIEPMTSCKEKECLPTELPRSPVL